MDVYKYQIWTCNIPGVYTPGCNDAFVMSSTTTATTVAQAQMANLQPMAVPAPKIPSSQYKTKLYGPPQSPSGMPAPNPCAGECGPGVECYQSLTINISYGAGCEGNFVAPNGGGLALQYVDPIILETLPSLPSWIDLYTAGQSINAIFNIYGPSYVGPVAADEFLDYQQEVGWEGPGAYEFFVCGDITAVCSQYEPDYAIDIVQYPPVTVGTPGGVGCDNCGTFTGIFFTRIHLKSCNPIEGTSYLELYVGFDSNWGAEGPQIGEVVLVNMNNSEIVAINYGGGSSLPDDVCGNLCFKIVDILVVDTPPNSIVDISQYPYNCDGELCDTNCPELPPEEIHVVDLTLCGSNIGAVWGSPALWANVQDIIQVSVEVNPDLLTASQNGDTVLINLNSTSNSFINESIFWACYNVGPSYTVPTAFISLINTNTIEIIDPDYDCGGPLCNTYPGAGCADPIASNYDDLAVDCYAGYTPGGSSPTDCCVYPTALYGCTDPSALNYYVVPGGGPIDPCNGYNGNPIGDYSSTGGLPCVVNNGVQNCCCAYPNTNPCPLAIQYGFIDTIYMGVWDVTSEMSGMYNPPGSQWNGWATVVEYPAGSGGYWFNPITPNPIFGGNPGAGPDSYWFQCEVNCIDPLASNYNPSTNVDCSGDPNGTDYTCCQYNAPCSNQLTIFLEQDFNDIGHYSIWDGEILQKDTFSNFTWSASTSAPWTVTVQNSTEFGFYEDTQGFQWTIDWGDGTPGQTVQYPTTQLTYTYGNPGTYTVNIQMSAPWGITSVSQPLTLPSSDASDPNFDPNPNATFTFNPPGGWATLPMNWLYSDWGPLDSGVEPQDYVTLNYTPPFCFTGVTESQLGAFETYSNGTNNPDLASGYFVNVPVPLGGQVEMPDGTIQDNLVGEIIAANTTYTAYTISDGSQGAIGYPVTLYDFDNGITIFESCSDGLKQYNMYTIDCPEEVTCDVCLGIQSEGIGTPWAFTVNVVNNAGVWNASTSYDGGDFIYHDGCCYFANGAGGPFWGPGTEPNLNIGNRAKPWFLCPNQNNPDCTPTGTGPGTGPAPQPSPCEDCFNQVVIDITGVQFLADSYFTGYFDLTHNYSVGNIVTNEICCWVCVKPGLGSSLGTPSPANSNWVSCPSNPPGCLGGSNSETSDGFAGPMYTDLSGVNQADPFCQNLYNTWVNTGYNTYNSAQNYNVSDVIYYQVTTGPASGTWNLYTPSPNPASVGFVGFTGVSPEPQNVGCYGGGCNPTTLTNDYWRGCAFIL